MRVEAASWPVKPSPDAFSLRENVHHLRDIDAEGFLRRLRRILSETDPELPGVDGARLASERRYNDHPHDAALEELTAKRAEAISRLRSLDAAQWARTGRMPGIGTIDMEKLLELWRAHDREHLEEVERLVEQVSRKGPGAES
jgi:hypothetical protein